MSNEEQLQTNFKLGSDDLHIFTSNIPRYFLILLKELTREQKDIILVSKQYTLSRCSQSYFWYSPVKTFDNTRTFKEEHTKGSNPEPSIKLLLIYLLCYWRWCMNQDLTIMYTLPYDYWFLRVLLLKQIKYAFMVKPRKWYAQRPSTCSHIVFVILNVSMCVLYACMFNVWLSCIHRN